MAKKRKSPGKRTAKTAADRPQPSARKPLELRLDAAYRRVQQILTAARDRAWQAVNTAMVEAYWEIGRVIVEEEQAGKGRADYGKRILDGFSARLTAEFGKGFDPSNLRNMRTFFLTYQIRDALRLSSCWLSSTASPRRKLHPPCSSA